EARRVADPPRKSAAPYVMDDSSARDRAMITVMDSSVHYSEPPRFPSSLLRERQLRRRRPGHADAVAAGALGFVERLVTPRNQGVRIALARDRGGDTDADARRDRLLAGSDGERSHLATDEVRHLLRARRRGIGKDDQEFVAAVPAADVGAAQ